MIKVKLQDLKRLYDGFNELAGMKLLPPKPGFWAGKSLKKVVAEAQEFENQRLKLVDQYAEKSPEGVPVVADGNYIFRDIEAFNKAYIELTNIEVELDITPMKLSSFGDTQVPPAVFFNLDGLIEEE